MKTYRIKIVENCNNRKQYCAQRKSIFGFWYNPDNIDGATTGWYNTLEEAEKVIQCKLHKPKITILSTRDNKQK